MTQTFQAHRRGLAIALAGGLAFAAPPALAEEAAPDFAAETLTGDWGGARTRLVDRGLDIRLDYTADLLSNLRGGSRRGTTFQGKFELGIDLDFERAIGWTGGSARISVLNIHGRSLTEGFVDSFAPLTGIDALPDTRLFEAWVQQEAWDGRLSLRLGQLAVDEEFMQSERADHFMNATFGWPEIFSAAMPSGGSSSPIATPGVRLRLGRADEGASVALAVLNGDPAGPGTGEPQRRNRTGANLRFARGALLIAEASYLYGGALPGTWRVGGWYHTDRFEELREEAPRRLRGNWGVYGVLDHTLWRPDSDSERGVGAFLRVAGVPSDRNELDVAFDAGVTWKGMLPDRPDDVLGFGVARARISNAARRLALAEDEPVALRRAETVLELSYAAAVAPGVNLQPVVQHVIHPGGDRDRPNAWVVGLRTGFAF
jgi:porin